MKSAGRFCRGMKWSGGGKKGAERGRRWCKRFFLFFVGKTVVEETLLSIWVLCLDEWNERLEFGWSGGRELEVWLRRRCIDWFEPFEGKGGRRQEKRA